MKIRALIVVSLLALLIGLPLALRRDAGPDSSQATRRLSIVTPHNETIRREFGRAFVEWWREKTGETIYVNWLTPGGTSEIIKVINSSYAAAEKDNREGIGIDIFWGGGDYDFRKMAGEFSDDDPGRFAKLRIFETHPELFGEGQIQQTMRGENYYGKNLDWIGVCLSSFGICYNVDGCERLGLEAPRTWVDLTDPRYVGEIALADPTKSGSVNKAFEMILQKEIQDEIRKGGDRDEAIAMGWVRGINVVRRIGANARYFTDSATKIPRDVADGNAVAGLCIDYYGRTFNELLKADDGSSRLQFIAPEGATSWSVDPVAILNGAPEGELAEAFVEFLMTDEGQRLWNVKAGAPDGPTERALRRLPVKPALYRTEGGTADFVDQENPYELKGEFEYDSSLTGPAFNPLRVLVRAMCIETHEELVAAWEALAEAGFPPQATAAFDELDGLGYREVIGPLKKRMKESRLEAVRVETELSQRFRHQYEKVKQLAEEGR